VDFVGLEFETPAILLVATQATVSALYFHAGSHQHIAGGQAFGLDTVPSSIGVPSLNDDRFLCFEPIMLTLGFHAGIDCQ
jgi:hypothetical protein